jgi:spermidine synthase
MRRTRLLLPASAFLLSGLAALVYQVVWQRVLALHTGVGVYSVAIIVAAFMAGLGVGSHVAGTLSSRTSARGALLAFSAIEMGVAVFGVLSLPLYYDVLYVRFGALYASPVLAGALQFAALLVPTLLMGMSLPFLVRGMVENSQSAGRTIGLLYGVNTILVRFLGFHGATLVAASANALAGVLALLAPRIGTPSVSVPNLESTPTESTGAGDQGRFPLWVTLYALSGFCALSLEILWFRLLDASTRSTAFTFGTLLSIFLLGSGSGCVVESLLVRRVRRPLRFFLLCQCGLLVYSGLAVAALVELPRQTPGIAWLYDYWRGGATFRLGSAWSPAQILGLYVFLPLALFGLPTVLMGASFPALQRAVQTDPAASGRRVGVLQAANIFGCVLGSLAVGLLGLSWNSGLAALRGSPGPGFRRRGSRNLRCEKRVLRFRGAPLCCGRALAGERQTLAPGSRSRGLRCTRGGGRDEHQCHPAFSSRSHRRRQWQAPQPNSVWRDAHPPRSRSRHHPPCSAGRGHHRLGIGRHGVGGGLSTRDAITHGLRDRRAAGAAPEACRRS